MALPLREMTCMFPWEKHDPYQQSERRRHAARLKTVRSMHYEMADGGPNSLSGIYHLSCIASAPPRCALPARVASH